MTCASLIGDRDHQHVALGGPELDDVGAVVLRAVDYDPVLALHSRRVRVLELEPVLERREL